MNWKCEINVSYIRRISENCDHVTWHKSFLRSGSFCFGKCSISSSDTLNSVLLGRCPVILFCFPIFKKREGIQQESVKRVEIERSRWHFVDIKRTEDPRTAMLNSYRKKPRDTDGSKANPKTPGPSTLLKIKFCSAEITPLVEAKEKNSWTQIERYNTSGHLDKYRTGGDIRY